MPMGSCPTVYEPLAHVPLQDAVCAGPQTLIPRPASNYLRNTNVKCRSVCHKTRVLNMTQNTVGGSCSKCIQTYQLFICTLFKETAISSSYIASNDLMNGNNEL